ncbi:MAG: TonB-dependent receptor [Dysgonamonadaceae bacterium]|jgi:TonB-linked SusC/RagA family outer membrane protein|nr:TonB-dependent receptor [Dysgonamonadaceae bacterium]
MNSKREFKREVSVSQIFKSLRNYSLLLACSVFMLALSVNTVSAETQQTVSISGTITDSSGEPLIGVNVAVKGTSIGTITGMDGTFTLSVAPGATVDVSYIGYLTQSFKVAANGGVHNITLREDSKSLEEVVVIGYGVQKKKLMTGATIQVSGDAIQRLSTTNVFTALSSKTPGVNITQVNGQPGSGYIVNIRGLGTNGEGRPLYIIDGVAAGNDALNHMSPADIESIDILKDAASAAIYGSRAANGVILVTTKQGKAGKPRISYDGYYGQQYMAKKPDMLNAKEYIQVQNEIRFNEDRPMINWQRDLPNGMYQDIMDGKWNGTDWVDAFYNKGAVTQSHAFNLTGGNEMSKFSIGYSFLQQDGIFGEASQSKYKRHTFRINSDHVLLKVKDFDAITIGQTLNYNYRVNSGVSTEGIYWNAFHGVLCANPLMPVYNADGSYYDYDSRVRDGWSIQDNFANPIGSTAMSSQGLNLSKNHGLRASAYLQIQPIKGLTFKSLYGYNMTGSTYRSQSQPAHWSNTSITNLESVDQNMSLGYSWTLDNTLTFTKLVDGHHITALIGQSVEKWGYGENVSAGGNNSIFNMGWDYGWVDNTKPNALSERRAGGSPWGQGGLASFFGRVMYNYKETYMATVGLRSDGSSNFARGKRWGYFPSVSGGWIVSNEAFMEGLKGKLDFLRLTANWGQNGNAAIGPFQYLSTYKLNQPDAVYFFGDSKQIGSEAIGAVPGVLQNPEVTWETNQMTDLGVEARFLDSRLGLTFNWYERTTKDWLLPAPISKAWGYDEPSMNGGDVRNRGVELSLSWNDRINDFSYGVNVNGSYNKNEVTKIANAAGLINGPINLLSQNTDYIYRLEVGQPMGFFYAYKTDGILQNQAEADAYNAITGGSSQPGDVRFLNADGKVSGPITPDDRVNIGNSIPTTRLGFSINMEYKGFDFTVTGTGAFGHLIAKSYRSFADTEYQNYTTDVFNRWTGEGTSNKWPRLTMGGSSTNYSRVSDIFFEKGDYVRIQNIILGYDFKRLCPQFPLSQARLYVSAQNLFTFTGYSGTDPDIGFSGDGNIRWAQGVDVGYYPSAKTFLMGVQLTF